MADPDPNPNVNLAGSGVALHVQRPDGEFVPVQGTNAGELPVTATGTGGADLATEVTVDRTADATEALALTIAPAGVPALGQDAIGVVNVDPPPTFAAAPGSGTVAEAFYIVGSIPSAPATGTPPGIQAQELLVSNVPGRLLNVTATNRSMSLDVWIRIYNRATQPTNGAAAQPQGCVHTGILVPRASAMRPSTVKWPFEIPLQLTNGCYLVVEDDPDAANMTRTAGNGCHITVQFEAD